jgi:spore coat protein CotH
MRISNRITTVILFIFLFSVVAKSKSLPKNMAISNDNNRLIINAQPYEGLYDIDGLKTIYLQFAESNWYDLLTSNYNTKKDLAAGLTYEGITYKNVGIRFRGQTSYQMVKNSKKKSFNISIDYLDTNQRLMGYKTLNLNNCFDDPSFMKEALYTALAGVNIPTAKTNFVLLVINGENWGIYSNVEQLNKDFFQEWFLSGDGTSWRAEYPDTSTAKPKGGQGGGGFGAGQCSLNYMSDDALEYSRYYTLKTNSVDNPWTNLAKACYMLNKLPVDQLYDSLKYYIDVDRCLWHIANEIVFTDDDGYVNKGGMDYYVYYDVETGRLQPIDFDGNSTFTTKNVNWSPFLKEADIKYPLINRLLANPALKQRYVAHVRSIINNQLDETYTNSIIDKYKNLIDTSVKADTKKLYAYTQYTSTINEIKNFIKNRKINLQNNAIIKAVPPVISSVTMKSADGYNLPPKSTESAIVNTDITSATGINKVLLYYGTGLMGTFNTIEMFDDGAHNDGNAADGSYGAEIPPFPAGTYIRYYIEARSANTYQTAAFCPEGAEHDVYYYQVASAILNESPIVINEIMASNTATIADPQGEYDDWIELYNVGANDVNLTGKYLSDKPDNLKKWQFPENTILKAGEYLLVWADENSKSTPGIHTNFKLSADGEIVIFTDSDANGNSIMDSVNFGPQREDVSYGRYPNGTGEFDLLKPTPGSINMFKLSADDNFAGNILNKIKIYPNPFSEIIKFELEIKNPGNYNIGIYDMSGRLINEIASGYFVQGAHTLSWDSVLDNGLRVVDGTYSIRIKSNYGTVSYQIVFLSN